MKWFADLSEAVAKKKPTLTDLKHWKKSIPHSMRIPPKPGWDGHVSPFKHADTYQTAHHHNSELDPKPGIKNKHHLGALEHYTADDSSTINHALHKGEEHKLDDFDKNTMKHLDDAIDQNRIHKNVHVYHGSSFDPRKHVDETGHFHSKAYLSCSHDKTTALSFSHNMKDTRNKKRNHIIHVHLKKGDPAIHASKYSSTGDDEHETIIKRGTKLKYHGTTTYGSKGKSWAGDTARESYNLTHVHHFTVAKDDKKDVAEGLAPKKVDNATILKHNNGPPLPKKKKPTLPTIKQWADHIPHSMRATTKEVAAKNPYAYLGQWNEKGKKFKYADKYRAADYNDKKFSEHTPIEKEHHKNAIVDYTHGSREVNFHLRVTKGKPTRRTKTIQDLDDAIDTHRASHDKHVYHGAGFDPRKHVDETGHFHSHEYLSASHSKEKALGFAERYDIQRDEHGKESSNRYRRRNHIMHIHVKKGDPALYVNHHSAYSGEHETIIKRGTKLKYHGTSHYFSKFKYGGSRGNIVHVHHFTIANSQHDKE